MVTLGARQTDETPVGMLSACHTRIREHIALARRLSLARGYSADDIHEAALRVARYFSIGLPLHMEDEDLSIAPRLVEVNPILEITIDVLESQHRSHEPIIEWLVSLCKRIERAPAELENVRDILSQTTELLAPLFDTHLEIEEQVVFPAITRLPASEQQAIAREIRARRALH